MKEFVVVAAADSRFFSMLLGLVWSIKEQASSKQPDLVVLDVGLTAEQRGTIQDMVTEVIDPPWDFIDETAPGFPSWFRAMTARPHLPVYVPGYEVYVLIDCDAWVQSWECVEQLIAVAKKGTMAIVEEVYGDGVSFLVPSERETREFTCSPEQVKRNVRVCYERNFGPEIAAWLREVPSFNAGVFALSAQSPAWQIWHHYMAEAIKRGGFHRLVDQLALNLAIRRNEITVTKMPSTCNFLCTHMLPAFDPIKAKFVSPNDGAVIGILHLADVKFARTAPINTFPDGKIVQLPLHYVDFVFSQKQENMRIFRSMDSAGG